MQITIEEALNAYVACNNLLKRTFPAKVSFKLARLIKELSLVEQTFNEIKNLTVKKYATRDENGEIITETLEDGKTFIPLPLSSREACAQEISDALLEKTEISEIYFNIEDFGTEMLLVEDLAGLLPFIEE